MSEIVDRFGRRRKAKPGDILGDGETLIVRLNAMDGKPFIVAFDAAGNPVRTGTFDAAQHRPGHRLPTVAAAAKAHDAYAARKAMLADAWRACR